MLSIGYLLYLKINFNNNSKYIEVKIKINRLKFNFIIFFS